MRRTALPHSWRSTSMLLTKLRGLVSGLDRIRERRVPTPFPTNRSEEHTSELQSQSNLVCRLLLEKKKNDTNIQSRSLAHLTHQQLHNVRIPRPYLATDQFFSGHLCNAPNRERYENHPQVPRYCTV